jgi:hypothetical protein
MTALPKRQHHYITWAIVVVGLGMLLFPLQPLAASGSRSPIRLVDATAERVVIEFTLPDYALEHVSAGGQTYVKVSAPGFTLQATPGAPQMPQIGALIGLPPVGAPSIQILEVKETKVSLAHPIYPAPVPVLARTGTHGALPPLPTYEFARDETIYAQDSPYPAERATIAELGTVRGYRVARVAFTPLRYNPARSELEITHQMLVEVRFGWRDDTQGDAQSAGASGTYTPSFERLLSEAVLNYETARHWPSSTSTQLAATALHAPATQAGSYKVLVDTPGLYRLTYTALDNAGLLPAGDINPHAFQLFEGEHEIDVQVSGGGDGRFDPGDSILFYGRVPRSRYTEHNVYWLRYGSVTDARMTTRDVTPGTQQPAVAWTRARYDENHFYDYEYAAADGDHWYAADLKPGNDHTASLSLMLPNAAVPTATLQVQMVGYTDNHHATFTVNGLPAGALTWSGHSPVTATMTLDRAWLNQGSNTVHVAVDAPIDGTWLDAIEILYPLQSVAGNEVHFWGQAGLHRYELGGFTTGGVLLYDISDPQHPVQLTGATGGGSAALAFADAPPQPATYLALTSAQIRQPAAILADAPSDLHSGANGADYLVVTHADFATAIQPLADYRQSQGLRVTVVDVQDIYDEFNGGLLHPKAIHDFFAHTYHNWTPPAPMYVLLVGDGSYDFLDHFGYGSVNYVPPYLAMIEPWAWETAADNRYAALDGNDLLPDVWVGRLPVSTVAEATAVVSKILSYEQTPLLGDWNARHVLVADDEDEYGNDFAASAEGVYNEFITDPWVGTRIYLDDLSEQAARQATLAAWQRGALLVSFVGHSSWHQWTGESLLHVSDVASLTNDRRWPVLLSMTCFTGLFQHPEYPTLDESLLRLDGGGAIATWSPSGLGVARGHDSLYKGFYEAVAGTDPIQLGAAVLAGQLRLLAEAPTYEDLLETHHLFGDPAMALNQTIRPWPNSTYLPIVTRNH